MQTVDPSRDNARVLVATHGIHVPKLRGQGRHFIVITNTERGRERDRERCEEKDESSTVVLKLGSFWVGADTFINVWLKQACFFLPLFLKRLTHLGLRQILKTLNYSKIAKTCCYMLYMYCSLPEEVKHEKVLPSIWVLYCITITDIERLFSNWSHLQLSSK